MLKRKLSLGLESAQKIFAEEKEATLDAPISPLSFNTHMKLLEIESKDRERPLPIVEKKLPPYLRKLPELKTTKEINILLPIRRGSLLYELQRKNTTEKNKLILNKYNSRLLQETVEEMEQKSPEAIVKLEEGQGGIFITKSNSTSYHYLAMEPTPGLSQEGPLVVAPEASPSANAPSNENSVKYFKPPRSSFKCCRIL